MMKAIQIRQFGGPENLFIGEWPQPQPGEREILVKVAATALNRADLLQRIGKYPPPPGESPVLGLEISGTVVAMGPGARRWQSGDQVCALLAGGGYAEYAVLHEDVALPVPENLSMEQAAAIPEAFLTAFQALQWLAAVQPGETILIHAGASGVGTAAIQLARLMQATAIATASAAKHPICYELGATKVIDYQTEDFEKVILQLTDQKGVPVIIDFLAAPYFQRNLNSLAMDGRLVMLALMGGAVAENVNLSAILRKRLHIIGSTLRARPLDYKIRLSRELEGFAWPHFRSGAIRPVIDSIFPWTEAASAHQYMEANKNQGKIVLKVEGGK